MEKEDSPFVYMAKYYESSFLTAEINDSVSIIKRWNVDTDTPETLLSYDFTGTGESVTGDIIMDMYAYNSDIYVLFSHVTKEGMSYYMKKFDSNGNELITYSSPDLESVLADNTPVHISGNRQYLYIADRNNLESNIFKIDDEKAAVDLIIGGGENYSLPHLSMLQNFDDKSPKYIFMTVNLYKPEKVEGRENVLFAFNTENEEIKGIRLIPEDSSHYLTNVSVSEAGNLVLAYDRFDEDGSPSSSAERIFYFVTAEKIGEILS